jgi:ATP-dependent protease ClpP protease subunit
MSEKMALDYYYLTRGELPTNEIFFYSDFNIPSAMKFNKDILNLVKLNENEKDKTITIRFLSQGGKFWAGFSMYNTIKEASKSIKIIGINDAIVGSTCVLPFLACSIRFSRPNALFLIHRGTSTYPPNTKLLKEDLEDEQKRMQTIDDIYDNIILKETNIEKSVYESYRINELYTTASELENTGFFEGYTD